MFQVQIVGAASTSPMGAKSIPLLGFAAGAPRHPLFLLPSPVETYTSNITTIFSLADFRHEVFQESGKNSY
jgi:hypothetical protein